MAKVDQDTCNKVCRLYSKGWKTDKIADWMGLAPSTVRLIKQSGYYHIEYMRLLHIQRDRKAAKTTLVKAQLSKLTKAVAKLNEMLAEMKEGYR